jgi:hypothetical protein
MRTLCHHLPTEQPPSCGVAQNLNLSIAQSTLIEQVDCAIDRSTDALALRLDTGIDTAGSYDVLINPGDIADGVLVNALWAVGQMVVRPRTSRRAAAELEVAGWMDTEALVRDGLPGTKLQMPGLSDAEAAELETALKRHEVQAALQVLFAARLTDAPETDAARAREAVRLALGHAPYADQVSEYFDDKVSDLVADLEGRVARRRTTHESWRCWVRSSDRSQRSPIRDETTKPR